MYILKESYIKLQPAERLYQSDKPIIAITGSIATGKSTVTHLLKNMGFAIIDADELVKRVYQTQDAINFIQSVSPQSVHEGEIQFPKLREHFFNNHQIKEKVENFIYSKLQALFLEEKEKAHQAFIIYDVPLLYEKNLHLKVDSSIVVYTPKQKQIERLKLRDNSSIETIKNILNAQIDIEVKKEKADYVIDNSGDLMELELSVQSWVSHYFNQLS